MSMSESERRYDNYFNYVNGGDRTVSDKKPSNDKPKKHWINRPDVAEMHRKAVQECEARLRSK